MKVRCRINYEGLASSKFQEGYNCAQSVVHAFSDRLKAAGDHLFQAATGLGGGMGRNQTVCGAVSGAALVLGMLYGRKADDGKEAQEKTYRKVRQLMQLFAERFGSVDCMQLLDGCELLTTEGQERYKAENMKERCHEYVAGAASLLDDVIGRE